MITIFGRAVTVLLKIITILIVISYFKHLLDILHGGYLFGSEICNSSCVFFLVSANRLHAVFILLEAFGNSRTIQNASATRFLQETSVYFDRGGVMTSISIQVQIIS